MTIEEKHSHAPAKQSRLKLAIILTGSVMLLEFAGGMLSHSLSLVSDAWHMLTHLFALGISYFAIALSMRPATKKRTYGFYRAEILAAFVNGIFLIFIAAYLIYEAVLRIMQPRPIEIKEMLIVALVGLFTNLASIGLLAKSGHKDLNIKSAILHALGDLVSSVAIVVGGLIIYFTHNFIVDPILSLFICVLIIIWSVKLLIESGNILLEAAPKHLETDVVAATFKAEIPHIKEIHHLHLWSISSSMYAMTAHVVLDDCKLSETEKILHLLNKLAKERFHIEHTNIQFECYLGQK